MSYVIHLIIKPITIKPWFVISNQIFKNYYEFWSNVIIQEIVFMNFLTSDIEPHYHHAFATKNPEFWDFINWFGAFIRYWDSVFSKQFANQLPKSHLFSIKNYRNQWAHSYSFSLRETYRVIDIIQLFYEEIGAPVDDMNMIRLRVLDDLFQEEKELL